jgi:hypothetical protein
MKTTKKNSDAVTSGGSATINGVLYQMLYSLLTAIKHKIQVKTPLKHNASGITILLEPQCGGGDIQTLSKDFYIVEQIKSKSTGTTWSLKQIIEDVLPDLFLAVDLNKTNTKFRFVTEGKMGKWASIYKYFQ